MTCHYDLSRNVTLLHCGYTSTDICKTTYCPATCRNTQQPFTFRVRSSLSLCKTETLSGHPCKRLRTVMALNLWLKLTKVSFCQRKWLYFAADEVYWAKCTNYWLRVCRLNSKLQKLEKSLNTCIPASISLDVNLIFKKNSYSFLDY